MTIMCTCVPAPLNPPLRSPSPSIFPPMADVAVWSYIQLCTCWGLCLCTYDSRICSTLGRSWIISSFKILEAKLLGAFLTVSLCRLWFYFLEEGRWDLLGGPCNMSICVAVFEIGRLVYKLVHSFVYSFIASCPDQCLLSVNTPCVLLPSFVLFFFDFLYGLSSHTFVCQSQNICTRFLFPSALLLSVWFYSLESLLHTCCVLDLGLTCYCLWAKMKWVLERWLSGQEA